MGLIKKSNELSIPKTVKMMVYGQAGMGKSTFAISAPKPLLIDFDNGVKRVNLQHLEGIDIVQMVPGVNSWNDVRELLNEDLSAYQSIVVDTVGKMMDFIISYKCGTRQPRVQDWTGINQEFAWFVREFGNLGKNLIFIAHRDVRKDGDNNVFVPLLREKNYNAIVTELDLLGYLEMKSENGRQTRTITFDPTDRNEGKNTCNLPSVMNIPNIVDNAGNAIGRNNFIGEFIIKPYLGMLDCKIEEVRKYSDVMNEISTNIGMITDADSANDFASRIDSFNHVGTSKAKARAMFSVKVKELKLVYDKDSKLYSNAEPAA